jgi:hypothetical protein
MAAKKKKAKSETKGKELFDFINMIYQDQKVSSFDDMSEDEKKKYHQSRYMIHRFLSMNPHYLPIVNEVQKYPDMPARAHYQFLCSLIPKGRQFNKYIKGNKEGKYESWMVELVANHFNVKKSEAMTYIELYIEKDIDELITLCRMYGTDMEDIQDALQL